MKKNFFRIICALMVLCLLFSGCAVGTGEETTKPHESTEPDETKKPRETAEQTEPDYSPMQGAAVEYLTSREFSSDRTAGKVSDEFRKALADFSFRLLNESRSEFEGDALLVSPLSAMLALAMTANGAEGKTLEEMENVFGGMYIEDLNEQLFNYTSSLISTDDAKFNLANAIWVTSSPSFSINRNFVKAVENTFDADIVAADMGDPATVDAINAWANEQTFGMIPEILDKDSINEMTAMVLLNAIALDALWQVQADDYACFEDTFKGVDESVQKTTFMWTECNGYIKGKRETGIVKNYRGGNYAFLALLPNDNISIYDYMASLDGESFLELYDKRKEARYNAVEINAKMPHFSFECSIDLIPVLEKMGMQRAFSGSTAEFGGLGTSTLGNLFIDGAVQKTFIELDNSGTRAAAVTAITMTPECAPSENIERYSIELDRPFVYAIIDTQTGLPIFLGVCDNIK